jgi:hypothetical protein
VDLITLTLYTSSVEHPLRPLSPCRGQFSLKCNGHDRLRETCIRQFPKKESTVLCRCVESLVTEKSVTPRCHAWPVRFNCRKTGKAFQIMRAPVTASYQARTQPIGLMLILKKMMEKRILLITVRPQGTHQRTVGILDVFGNHKQLAGFKAYQVLL